MCSWSGVIFGLKNLIKYKFIIFLRQVNILNIEKRKMLSSISLKIFHFQSIIKTFIYWKIFINHLWKIQSMLRFSAWTTFKKYYFLSIEQKNYPVHSFNSDSNVASFKLRHSDHRSFGLSFRLIRWTGLSIS